MTRSNRYTCNLLYLVAIVVVGFFHSYDVSATMAATTTTTPWWGLNQRNTKLVTTTKRSICSSESSTKNCAFFVSQCCRGGDGDDNNDNDDTNNNSDLTEETVATETAATTDETTTTDSEEILETSGTDDTDVDVNIDKEITMEDTDSELPSSTTTASSTTGSGKTSSSSTINLISTSDSRLPMSITTVVADLEAEGYNELSTACLIVSKSVSNKQRQILLNSLSSSSSSSSSSSTTDTSTTDTDTSTSTTDKVFGYSNGLLITNPLSINEVSTCTVVCNGTILYYANDIDIERNEGLFISLAPAIETIVKTTKSTTSSTSIITPTLYIIGNEQLIRSQIEKSAALYLSSMVQDNNNNKNHHQSSSITTKIRTLNDVFSKIIYIPTIQTVVSTIVTNSKQSLTTTTPEIISSTVATVVASSSSSTSTSTDYSTTATTKKQTTDNDALNLAAARILGPPARVQLRRTIEIIQNACQSSSSSSSINDKNVVETMLVPEFGALCTAAVNTAIADLTMTQSTSSSSSNTINSALQSSDIGKQIKQNFLVEIDSQLTDILEQQFIILQTTLFEQCKKQLSKLLISPNLQNDMYTVLQSSIKSFTQIGTKLISTQYITNGSSMLSSYTVAYSRQLVSYITNRLLSARVSGQYKPLPKKGITVGLHWLLPKPFGNDYRQEPWMVHSTDNMVYIPSSKKLSDIDPNTDVRTGDWRTKIIPNPAGNDMLYMQ